MKPAYWEEEGPKHEENVPELADLIDNFTEITEINIKEVMENTENKFIFYLYPSKTSPQYLNAINAHSAKMKGGLRCTSYFVDMEKNGELFIQNIKSRNSSRNIDEQIENNTFILANKDDDIWFWDDMLITYFQGELLEQIFNFYNGVRELHDEHELMISMTENDNHFIIFCKEFNKENNRKLKNLRRFQTKNTDSFLKLKFWIVKDEEFAKRLGIDINGELGDLYLLKEWSKFNQLKSTTNIEGKDLYVQKINNISDTSKGIEYHIQIINIALTFPIIVHDFMGFAQLYSKYQSPSLIVYWDKNDPNFNKILSEVYKTRQNYPLVLNEKKAEEKKNPNHNLKENLLFIVSTCPMLIPLLKLSSKQPRAILAVPEHDSDDVIDLRNKYWSHLKKIDGMPIDEYYKMVEEKPHLKENNQDEKDTKKARFSEDRYKLQKSWSISGDINESGLTYLIEQAQLNKMKNFFESEDIPEVLFSEKVVGEDFKRKVLQSKHDWVVFLENPIQKENRDYGEKFERSAKLNKNSDVKYYRITDFNETDTFKLMKYNSPTVLYFKKNSKENPIQLDIRRDLVSNSLMKTACERLENFINKNANSKS